MIKENLDFAFDVVIPCAFTLPFLVGAIVGATGGAIYFCCIAPTMFICAIIADNTHAPRARMQG